MEVENATELQERDIVVQKHDGHSQRIRHYYGLSDALQYPLLFPSGELGWLVANLPGTFLAAIGMRMKTSDYYCNTKHNQSKLNLMPPSIYIQSTIFYYTGIGLEIRKSSIFIFHPPILEATGLQTW